MGLFLLHIFTAATSSTEKQINKAMSGDYFFWALKEH